VAQAGYQAYPELLHDSFDDEGRNWRGRNANKLQITEAKN